MPLNTTLTSAARSIAASSAWRTSAFLPYGLFGTRPVVEVVGDAEIAERVRHDELQLRIRLHRGGIGRRDVFGEVDGARLQVGEPHR